ncbi:MAG: methyltransferase domain-containing protein [Gemmatimonadetes bacterium]|nr:methyltransferase domain-containing protein [Gemmatimonadota bacterium]
MDQAVLVAEDDARTRESLTRALTKAGYRTVAAPDGGTALATLATEPVAVLLTDLKMPGVDGMSLLERVRAEFPETVVIILTAFGTVDVAVEAMKKGAYDFVTKPVNLDKLERLLQHALEGRRLVQENRELRLRLHETTGLRQLLGQSAPMRQLREATLARKPSLHDDPFRFLTGGGDWEHAWSFSGGDPLAPDPYYPIGLALVRHVMTTLGQEKRARRNLRSGYDAPLVLHAMGEGAIACGTADGALAEQPVLTLHSNCVLSFDVDKPRAKVREFYGAAAEKPKPDLCCPTRYDDSAIAHIPQDVIDRFYGCGSPVSDAGIRPGETVVDLGSGAGIDVFIAAKLVGPEGKAIGVDMTDEMLAVASENRPRVAAALGYDVVEFRKGFLEAIPVESKTVDVVTSNCVVNLSPDKPLVFEEIWRVLKDHGRFVIADIVSERPVPPHLKVNPELWGECLVGALTQDEFLARLERAGFYGLTLLKKTYWKDVEGYPFFSITVQGFKYEKTAGCVFQGHRAVYLGPGKAFVDEEGHTFPRNEPYEVCTDTVAKLGQPPYAGSFAILEPGEERAGYACCGPDGRCC